MSDFSNEDFTGDTYRLRKRILVTIFSQVSPFITQGPNIGNNADKKILSPSSHNDIDAEYLQDVFRQIHHPENAKVEILNGRTQGQVTNYIQDLDGKPENLQYDMFFFVFLTFMSNKAITKGSACKDERIHLKDGIFSMEEFYNVTKKSKVMRMKPKIFLIQADDLRFCKPKTGLKGDKEIIEKKIPQDADRLIIMSDIPQRIAIPDPDIKDKKTSFLIQAFGETLIENSRRPVKERLDLYSLTPLMNMRVLESIKGISREEEMSVPLVTSTLTKLVKI